MEQVALNKLSFSKTLVIDININHINNLIIKESSYLLTSLSITRNGSLRYDYFHGIMPSPEFSVFVATKCHCSFSTCHGSCGWLEVLEDADGTCINVDYENIHRFGLWEHALSGFSAGYPEVRMMPVSCRTAHYIKELNKDTNLLVL